MTVDSAPIVSLRDVRRDYALGAERVHALQGVSLSVRRGEVVDGKTVIRALREKLQRRERGD